MGSKLTIILVLALAALAGSGCAGATGQAPTPTATTGNSQLANPAAVYCEEQGYDYQIRTAADGSQSGVCVFPDGSECDGWAFYRGECGPGQGPEGPTGGGDTIPPEPNTPEPAAGLTVTGWLAAVVSAPDGAQFDDYLVLQPEGAGKVGVSGATDEIEAEVQALRDKAEPGKYAHFWGTLVRDVPDYGNVQLVVTQLRYGATYAEAEPVEAWVGTLTSNPPGAQFDDYFLLDGEYAVGYGINSLDPGVEAELQALRDTGTKVRVWGQLRCGVPDAFGSQIEVTRLESVE